MLSRLKMIEATLNEETHKLEVKRGDVIMKTALLAGFAPITEDAMKDPTWAELRRDYGLTGHVIHTSGQRTLVANDPNEISAEILASHYESLDFGDELAQRMVDRDMARLGTITIPDAPAYAGNPVAQDN